MCEFLFRGKRKDNGEWVESGSIIRGLPDADKSHYRYYIGSAMRGTWYLNQQGNITAAETHEECIFYEVDPETVGLYIGRTDMKRKKIFVGDIVQRYKTEFDPPRKYKDPYEVHIKSEFPVAVEEYYSAFEHFSERVGYEVIGNIHDNPELLEVSK